MNRGLALTAAVFLLAACHKPLRPLPPGALRTAIQDAKSLPPCSSVIANEWPYTWPVPLADAQASRFKILFYPFTGDPGAEPSLLTPAGEAVLDARMGKPTTCQVLPGIPKVISHQRWPSATDELSMKDFQSRQDELYEKTQTVASLYNSGRGVSPPDAASAKQYLEAFESLAEPDLLPYYYRMNPAFWEWLRGATGRSIPKAP
jgi:hypothetical protein